jgi:Raf kinase inhibitor-like YbhB/YbcL family protein
MKKVKVEPKPGVVNRKSFLVILFLFGFFSIAFESFSSESTPFQLTSDSFQAGGEIPPAYTCQGQSISPELHWTGVPEKTKSFALICDDPDAPGRIWVHWVIYNIPIEKEVFKTTFKLLEAFPKQEITEKGIRQGTNDFGRIGYDGPCPPSGTHRYYFKLYALDSLLNLKPGSNKLQLLGAMKGHILAMTQLMGTFGK